MLQRTEGDISGKIHLELNYGKAWLATRLGLLSQAEVLWDDIVAGKVTRSDEWGLGSRITKA